MTTDRRLHSKINGFKVVSDPTGTYTLGGSFGRYDFLLSLSGRIWPEGMVVEDAKCRMLRVMYVEHDRFLVNTATEFAWKLSTSGAMKLVRHGWLGEAEGGGRAQAEVSRQRVGGEGKKKMRRDRQKVEG